MLKWQYCVYNRAGETHTINFCDGKGPHEIKDKSPAHVLQRLGAEGFELISVVNNTPLDLSISYFFKRPVNS